MMDVASPPSCPCCRDVCFSPSFSDYDGCSTIYASAFAEEKPGSGCELYRSIFGMLRTINPVRTSSQPTL